MYNKLKILIFVLNKLLMNNWKYSEIIGLFIQFPEYQMKTLCNKKLLIRYIKQQLNIINKIKYLN